MGKTYPRLRRLFVISGPVDCTCHIGAMSWLHPRSGDGMARERYPALDIHLVEHARHLVHWDSPEVFTRLVADFVTGNASAARGSTA